MFFARNRKVQNKVKSSFCDHRLMKIWQPESAWQTSSSPSSARAECTRRRGLPPRVGITHTARIHSGSRSQWSSTLTDACTELQTAPENRCNLQMTSDSVTVKAMETEHQNWFRGCENNQGSSSAAEATKDCLLCLKINLASARINKIFFAFGYKSGHMVDLHFLLG